MIAAQAAMERGKAGPEVKALNHFVQLFKRVKGTQTISIGDGRPHEQTAVAAEEDPVLLLSSFGQLFIVIIVLVKTIESQHSQIGSQPPKVSIEQEARFDGASVWNGIDVDLVSILGDRAQAAFLPIDFYDPDLGVWNAQGFH